MRVDIVHVDAVANAVCVVDEESDMASEPWRGVTVTEDGGGGAAVEFIVSQGDGAEAEGGGRGLVLVRRRRSFCTSLSLERRCMI